MHLLSLQMIRAQQYEHGRQSFSEREQSSMSSEKLGFNPEVQFAMS